MPPPRPRDHCAGVGLPERLEDRRLLEHGAQVQGEPPRGRRSGTGHRGRHARVLRRRPVTTIRPRPGRPWPNHSAPAGHPLGSGSAAVADETSAPPEPPGGCVEGATFGPLVAPDQGQLPIVSMAPLLHAGAGGRFDGACYRPVAGRHVDHTVESSVRESWLGHAEVAAATARVVLRSRARPAPTPWWPRWPSRSASRWRRASGPMPSGRIAGRVHATTHLASWSMSTW